MDEMKPCRHEVCKIPGLIEGSDAYERFKEIARAFFGDGKWFFVALELKKEPSDTRVEFEAIFWREAQP